MVRSVPPSRPLLIFDGDCGFCRRSVRWLLSVSGGAVDAVESQQYDFSAAPAGVTPAACDEAVFLLEPRRAGGVRVSRGGAAALRALGRTPGLGFVPVLWRLVPGLPALTEWAYRAVARNRGGVSRLVSLVAGPDPTPPRWALGRRLLLAVLGLAFLAHFAGLWLEVDALLGSGGIRPVAALFPEERAAAGWRAWLQTPSLLWLNPTPAFLRGLLLAGTAGAALLVAGVLPLWGLLASWLAVLSFSGPAFVPSGVAHSGNVFGGWQWDGLLLEVGLLALLVAPWRLRADPRHAPAGLPMWLLRFTLARVMFVEGLTRLASDGWTDGGGLRLHWWTQPLPTSWALWAQDLPGMVVAAASALLWLGELLAPPLLLGPRRLRNIGVVLVVGHELLRLGGGITGPFPLALLALALAAVDDATWRRLARRGAVVEDVLQPRSRAAARARGLFAVAFVALAVTVSVRFVRGEQQPGPVTRWTAPWQICNAYAPAPAVRAFAGRPPQARSDVPEPFGGDRPYRAVLVIEARSAEGGWRPLWPAQADFDPFDLPPGPRPWVRRLDWMLAEVARSVVLDRGTPPWFDTMVARLLAESAVVRRQFSGWPDAAPAPAAVRVRAFAYRPASAAQRAAGQGWERRPLGIDGPAWRLQDGVLVPAD